MKGNLTSFHSFVISQQIRTEGLFWVRYLGYNSELKRPKFLPLRSLDFSDALFELLVMNHFF